jgi:hypothetical protein
MVSAVSQVTGLASTWRRNSATSQAAAWPRGGLEPL